MHKIQISNYQNTQYFKQGKNPVILMLPEKETRKNKLMPPNMLRTVEN